MNKKVKIALLCVLAVCLAGLVLYGVQHGKSPENISGEIIGVTSADSENDITCVETAEKLKQLTQAAIDNGNTQKITLSDSGCTAPAGVRTENGTVTIGTPGIYLIGGQLTQGQLAVDCDGTVVLITDSISISNTDDAAINVCDASHVLIYMPEGSTSTLTSGEEKEISAQNTDEDAQGAAVYSKDNLSFAGTGKLIVNGYINNAVATTDNLTVLEGEFELNAVNNGLKGKDSVTIEGGTLTLRTGNDGIKSENDSENGKGNILINAGTVNIVCDGDGIQAGNSVTVNGGSMNLLAGETAEATAPEEEVPQQAEMPAQMPGGIPGEIPGNMPGEMPSGGDFRGQGRDENMQKPEDGNGNPRGDKTNNFTPGNGGFGGMPGKNGNDTGASSSQSKGICCNGTITVGGGNITVNSGDDCIHADESINISGGTLVLASGDDGLHTEGALNLSGGDITISRSNEGVEGSVIEITGGTLSVNAGDDGINAAEGDFMTTAIPLLKISGGTVYVNAYGDGLDSNGDIVIEGGTVITDGPENNGNGALDSGTENGGSLICNGGTVLAIGASGMAEGFTGASEQCQVMLTLSQTATAGTVISISNENANVLFEHTSAKSFSSVVFSCPEISEGGSYTVSLNGTEYSATGTRAGGTAGTMKREGR